MVATHRKCESLGHGVSPQRVSDTSNPAEAILSSRRSAENPLPATDDRDGGALERHTLRGTRMQQARLGLGGRPAAATCNRAQPRDRKDTTPRLSAAPKEPRDRDAASGRAWWRRWRCLSERDMLSGERYLRADSEIFPCSVRLYVMSCPCKKPSFLASSSSPTSRIVDAVSLRCVFRNKRIHKPQTLPGSLIERRATQGLLIVLKTKPWWFD
jgi:hypothetical protein